MKKQQISTTKAPAAIGPYSQAIRAGDFVFCSGQIPLDPETGAMVQESIEAETHRVMKNLTAVLEAAQVTLRDVVKTTIFLTNMGDFATVNAVYQQYFETEPPARSTVQVAALPKGARVEVEAIAYHVKG